MSKGHDQPVIRNFNDFLMCNIGMHKLNIDETPAPYQY